MRIDIRWSGASLGILAAAVCGSLLPAIGHAAPTPAASVAPAANAAATVATQTVPDVQIVISPDPMTGQWVVAAVYPGVVTKEKALGRAKSLISLTGWKAHDLVFDNRALQQASEVKGLAPAPPTMSSVSFETADRVVDWRTGAVTLEPLIRAYRDLTHLNVLYMIPGTFSFHGLRHYSDSHVDLTVAAGQGAYAYTAVVKDHALGPLNLPLTETDTRSTGSRSLSRQPGRIGAAVAVLAAILAAVLAFVAVRRWTMSRGGA